MRNLAEKTVTLDCIDRRWTKHIDQMSKLRDAIWLRSYAQTDPLQAYTNEGFSMFDTMNANIATDAVRTLLHVAFRQNPQPDQVRVPVETGDEKEVTNPAPSASTQDFTSNVKPDEDEVDRSNPTAKIN